ncbi:secreted RxLR effector protein 161-like [Arachis hypogaea]|uniref:secreted RxLR effector protein 161-like n=1 Tax=Arachis hypogaea TaxID=3818 RepID=UPI003B21B2D6
MCPSSEAERMKMSRVSYASAVGSLMYAMICTRPDIAQAVAVVSQFMADPGKKHWNVIKRILRYIKGTSNVALCFGGSEFIVNGYVDSDFAGDLDKQKSTTGYVFTLAEGPVSWLSKLQTVVALSTTKAEYMAATQACKEAIWIQRLIAKTRAQTTEDLCGYENSQEAIGRIVCANCYLANKSVNIEIPQMVLFDTVFEAVVRIPYNMRIKQFLANDKKF